MTNIFLAEEETKAKCYAWYIIVMCGRAIFMSVYGIILFHVIFSRALVIR